MNELISGLIGAVLGGFLSFKSNKENLSDSLDSKSGWREKLFNVASTNEIDLDDVYRVRASLRYCKHEINEELVPFSFNWMSNLMTDYCEWIVEKRKSTINVKITKNESEIIRIFCRYLLKNHWEYRESMGPKIATSKQNYNSVPQSYAIETMELFVKELKNMNDSYFLRIINRDYIEDDSMNNIEIRRQYNSLSWWSEFLFKGLGIFSILLLISIIFIISCFKNVDLTTYYFYRINYRIIWLISLLLISISVSFFITPAKLIIKN